MPKFQHGDRIALNKQGERSLPNLKGKFGTVITGGCRKRRNGSFPEDCERIKWDHLRDPTVIHNSFLEKKNA